MSIKSEDELSVSGTYVGFWFEFLVHLSLKCVKNINFKIISKGSKVLSEYTWVRRSVGRNVFSVEIILHLLNGQRQLNEISHGVS